MGNKHSQLNKSTGNAAVSGNAAATGNAAAKCNPPAWQAVPFSCSFSFHGAGDAGSVSICERGELHRSTSSFCTMEHFHHSGCADGKRERTRILPQEELSKLQLRFAALDAFAVAAKPSDDALAMYDLTVRFSVTCGGETRTITCRTPNYHALPTSLLPDALGAFVEELLVLADRGAPERDGSVPTVSPEQVSAETLLASVPARSDDETAAVIVIDNGGYRIKVRLDNPASPSFSDRILMTC
jgi:hypothetical protein